VSISVSVSSPSISAAVTQTGVAAAVASTAPVSATVQGGIGPAGVPGSTTIAGATDVELSGVANGDVLRYSNSKWRNYAETDLFLLDAGNF
jgi:hypothetical protein